MALARAETTGGAILYDARLIELPVAADFDPGALGAAGRVRGQARGRGQAWFLSARAELATSVQWVLRHYRRGGLVARLSRDCYLWAGETATRSFAEAELLAFLVGRGLAVPSPVAARYVRAGLFYRADLITVAIPGTHTLASRCGASAGEPWSRALGLRIGQAIRRLHDEGVWHADLNAHNVLIDEAEQVWIIDFDRARLRRPGRWREQNLVRLRRSLDKVHAAQAAIMAPAGWAAIEAGYAGGV